MEMTTCVFTSWHELDMLAMECIRETFGAAISCETERDDDSWRIFIHLPEKMVAGTPEYQAFEEKFLPLLESLSHGETAPDECGWPPQEIASGTPDAALMHPEVELPQSESEALLSNFVKAHNLSSGNWAESMATRHGVFFFEKAILNLTEF